MKGKESFFEILKGAKLLFGLKTESLSRFGEVFSKKTYDTNKTIFSEGDLNSSMMIITKGKVRISQFSESGAEEALIVLKKGDIFGEMAMLEDMPRSAAAIADTDTEIYEITKNDFNRYIRLNPEDGVKILHNLCRTLSSRLRDADVKLKYFVSLSQWI